MIVFSKDGVFQLHVCKQTQRSTKGGLYELTEQSPTSYITYTSPVQQLTSKNKNNVNIKPVSDGLYLLNYFSYLHWLCISLHASHLAAVDVLPV